MLLKRSLSFLMEAHNGISAKIVEESGFEGIWASSLGIATALGVRDSNEASWTQVLEVLEFMSDATSLPILLDGDTGYGNFNNVRRLVRKLCQRGIAGVCIEDKLFPKTNSLAGEAHDLADIDEFCGRIKAGKDSQTDGQFSIVARIEALIAGRGMHEALRRAEAYHRAGADAVLIHSKKTTPAEILEFAEIWQNRCPVVIVPTTYHATPTQAFRKAGISVVIWANHLIRAAIGAMRAIAERIQRDQCLHQVEGEIVGVGEIFRIVGNAELEEAARHYLPAGAATRAIILAASQGRELGRLTDNRPKCMIDVHGQPLLRRLVAALNSAGVRHITVVRGYRKEAIDLAGISVVDNDDYASTGEVASLMHGFDRLGEDCVIVYGDVLFRRYVLDGLLATEGEIIITVDRLWRQNPRARLEDRDLVQSGDEAEYDGPLESPPLLARIGGDLDPSDVTGEWIGLMRVRGAGMVAFKQELQALDEGERRHLDVPALLQRLARRLPVHVHYVAGDWIDVDTIRDLADARNFSRGP
ncbi:MAG: phosphoenolpyruvate mutase [Acetobacteraceae bacterium]|nr:phosphoenolpyruvate mutase [Acetobacteraceae bacterium]